MIKRQQGLTTVEAAIGAALMLVILLGIIEISRLVFVWNFLDEATRRGARVAAVCPFDHPAVRRVAIFSTPNGSNNSPLVNSLTTNNVNIDYMDAAGNLSADFAATKYVRASINGFQIPLLMFNRVTLTAPPFSTTLPSESLGYNPDTGTCRCYGVQGSTGAEGCDAPP